MTINLIIMLLSWVGMFFAYKVGQMRERNASAAREPESIKPVCPCGHNWGSHVDGKICQSAVKLEHYNSFGERSGWKWASCACTFYHGPTIITEEFFNPGRYTP